MKSGLESFQELRIAYRMADKDLPFHAARMYLWGNNSPFSHEGTVSFLFLTSLSFSLFLSAYHPLIRSQVVTGKCLWSHQQLSRNVFSNQNIKHLQEL